MSEQTTPPPAESLSASFKELISKVEKKQKDAYKRFDELSEEVGQKHGESFVHYDKLLGEAEQKNNEINTLHNKLLGNSEEGTGESTSKTIDRLLNSIREKETQAFKHLDSVGTTLKFIETDRQNEVKAIISTKTKMEELLEEAGQKHGESCAHYDKLLGEAEQKNNEINTLHKQLLGNSEEGTGESTSKDINDLLDGIKTAKEEFDKQVVAIKEQAIKSEEKTDALHKQIEDLLPGATSAGLAESYKENEREYQERWMLWTVFISSLAGLLYLYILLIIFSEPDISTIIARIAVGFPLIWVAWYCQRTLSQRQKIKEEYKHKQKMMQLYEGFMKQIKALGEEDKELQKEMVKVMLKAIGRNPAEFMGTPDTILDSKAKAILAKATKNNTPKTPEKDDKAT